jgi:hypothetical protein
MYVIANPVESFVPWRRIQTQCLNLPSHLSIYLIVEILVCCFSKCQKWKSQGMRFELNGGWLKFQRSCCYQHFGIHSIFSSCSWTKEQQGWNFRLSCRWGKGQGAPEIRAMSINFFSTGIRIGCVSVRQMTQTQWWLCWQIDGSLFLVLLK